MSLEQRCLQFHEAALGTPGSKSKGPIKEIATLRKFLHRNQDQRFTDKGVSRLFDTIQIYTHKEELDVEQKEGLLEDALKMPFTVFSTKQKKSMLKWLENLRGGGAGAADEEGKPTKTQILSLIDLIDDKMSLMDDDTGDLYEDVVVPGGELGDCIQKSFQDTEKAVSVEVVLSDSTVREVIRVQVE